MRAFDMATASADEIREEAKRRALRRAQGATLHPTPAELLRAEKIRDDRLERDIQAECVRIYRAHGCRVRETSQKRRSRVSPGIPDLLVFHPRLRVRWDHEVKTPSGVQSHDQKLYQEDCEASGGTYVLGGVEAAWSHLRRIGAVKE